MDEVSYEWAGMTVGGQGLYDCARCGALVREEQQIKHTVFHDLVEETMQSTLDAVQTVGNMVGQGELDLKGADK